MIQELVVQMRAAGERQVPVLGLVSTDPERDLAALSPYRLEVVRDPAGGLRVERVGRPGAVARLEDPDPELESYLAGEAAPYVLAMLDCEAPESPVFLFPAWPGDDRVDVLRRALEEARRRREEGDAAGARGILEARLAEVEEPRLLLARAEHLHQDGHGGAAASSLHRALEVYSNFLPALAQVVEWDEDPVLARMALARMIRLDPDGESTAAAASRLVERLGDSSREEADRAAETVDPGRPFREQWSGAGWTAEGRTAPLTPAGIYRLCLVAAFRDKKLEPWEEDLAREIAGALHLPPEERRSALEEAQRTASLHPDEAQPLDRTELFQSLAAMVLADGVMEDEELECLERVREVLEVSPDEALSLMMNSDERQREVWKEVENFLRDPWDSRVLQRLRRVLFLGSGTLRPGLADTYAAALDQVRVDQPEALSLLLPPLHDLGRYSARLVKSFCKALETAAACSSTGRTAAMAAASANPRQRDFHVAVARGLSKAVEREEVPPLDVLRDLRLLAALSPDSDGLTKETAAIRRRLGLIAEKAHREEDVNPFVETGQARAARRLARLRACAPRGEKAPLVQAFEDLEEGGVDDPFLRLLREEGRTEVCLAASFHQWRDVLEACLSRDLEDAGRKGAKRSAWGQAVRLLAAADLAARRGRGSDVSGYRVRYDMLVDPRLLTKAQEAFCSRRWEELAEAGE